MKRFTPWLLGALLTLPLFACLNGTEVDGGAANGDTLNDDANGGIPITPNAPDDSGTVDTGGTADTTAAPEDTAAVVTVATRINVPTDTTEHPGVRKVVVEMTPSPGTTPIVRDTIVLQAFVMELSYPDPVQLQESYALKSGRSWAIFAKALDAGDVSVYTATASLNDLEPDDTRQIVLTFE